MAEELNEVNPESYHKDRGGPEFGGAELASDGPIHKATANVCPVPNSPAADGVNAGVKARKTESRVVRGRHAQRNDDTKDDE